MSAADRLLSWLRPARESALDRLLDLERRDLSSAEDHYGSLPPGEAWEELVERSLWMEACRDAAARRSDKLLAWARDPSSCWALTQLETGSPEYVAALHVARLAAMGADLPDGREIDEWRPLMTDALAAAHTLPLPPQGAAANVSRDTAEAMIGLQARWLAGRDLVAVRRREIGVVFESARGRGLTGRLSMEVIANGPPGLFPHPRTMSLFSADPEFARALGTAWALQNEGRRRRTCLVWHLQITGNRGRRVKGASLGAAFAILPRELLGPPTPGTSAISRLARWGRALSGWLRHPYKDHVVTGDVDSHGTMVRVKGMQAKFSAARAEGLTVVGPRANSADVTDEEHYVGVDDVWQARRRLYRLNRGRTMGLAVTVALAVAVTIGIMYRNQEEERLRQDDLMLSRVLASQSYGHHDTEPRKAITLALAAWTATPSAEALSALLTAHGHLINNRLVQGTGITGIAYSGDGRILATMGEDHRVRLWSTVSRTLIATLGGPTAPVNAIAFSGDGSMIATASQDRTVRLWSTSTYRQLAVLTGHRKAVSSVSFSRDSRSLVSVGGDVRVWRTSGRLEAVLKVEAALWAQFRSGFLVVIGKRVEVFDLKALPKTRRTGTLPYKGENPFEIGVGRDGRPKAVRTTRDMSWLSSEWTPVASGPGGEVVAAIDRRGFPGPPITLWSATNGNLLASVAVYGKPGEMEFSPDGRTLAVVDGGTSVTLLDTGLPPTGSPNPVVNDIAFGAEGRLAAAASGDGTISWWRPGRGASDERRVPAHPGGARTVAISPDGRTLVSGGNDGKAKVWDLTGRKAKATLNGHTAPVVAVTFSKDGRVIVTGDAKDHAIVWDARTFRKLRDVDDTELQNWYRPLGLTALALSPDGHTLMAAGSSGIILLIDLDGQGRHAQLANFGGFIKRIRDITLRPDGRAIISADVDGTITAWDLAPVIDEGSTSATGRLMTAGGDDSNAVAYAPDGRTVAIARTDQTITLLDPATQHVVATLRGHTGGVLSVSYRADGRRLLGADTSGAVREWNLDPRQAVSDLCSMLTPQSWNDSTLARAEGWPKFLARFSLADTCGWPSSRDRTG
ncbi:WD40 repeat domain-containing protein [Nonomuraea candida]|uniref:WD40 repeat domain-containing protein n=1 Tax=Nonomuraea candida TaxID=359159 RepID=UPI0005BD120E|nr:WD40 repeat domain-containing protein [Nonomuraea candida]